MYDVGYRTESTIGLHLNLNVLSQYLPDPETRDLLLRVAPTVRTPTYISTVLNTAVPATALLAAWVLQEAGSEPPVAHMIVQGYEDAEVP